MYIIYNRQATRNYKAPPLYIKNKLLSDTFLQDFFSLYKLSSHSNDINSAFSFAGYTQCYIH